MESTTAKQFLISRVIEEAEVEQVNLSDVEKKMLYFTEVSPSLPDIYEVNAEFERDYNSDEYEAKVVSLLRNARERDRRESSSKEQTWKDVLDALRKEDHYILVMVYRAFPEYRQSPVPTHRVRDYVVYIAVGIAVVLVCIGIAILSH
ncbi:MAG: hypothetical protein ABSA78_15090 [Candidatus Sulfotelmatobacter sp.]